MSATRHVFYSAERDQCIWGWQREKTSNEKSDVCQERRRGGQGADVVGSGGGSAKGGESWGRIGG